MINLKQKATAAMLITLTVFFSCKKEEQPELYMRGGNSIVLTPDGQMLTCGYNTVDGNGYDATLLLTDQQGNLIKSNTYGDSYTDDFFSVVNNKAGGFVAAGFTQLRDGSSPRTMVVFAGADLAETQKLIYGTLDNQGFNIIACSDSGYLASGYVQTSGYNQDLYLVRINNTGDAIWEKHYGAAGKSYSDTVNDVAYCALEAPGGGFFVCGTARAYPGYSGRMFLMKVSAAGDSLWTKFFSRGVAYSIKKSQDGNLLIGGTIQETGTGSDIAILKIDPDGNVLWNKRYTESGYEYGSTLITTADGGCAITGISDSQSSGDQNFILLKANASGEKTWSKTYGGTSVEQAFGLVQMSDGGFSMAGMSNSGGSFIYLVGAATDGSERWISKLK